MAPRPRLAHASVSGAYIQMQRGKYRARFVDPLGRVQSRTFTRKADAERFLRQIDADRLRGKWIDPRDADLPVAVWAEEFLLLCRRLAPSTQETYRRDLERYVSSHASQPRAMRRVNRLGR